VSGHIDRATLGEARELRDDGRYEFTCEKGHTTVVVLQQMKFEVLFEYGLNAIVDGYYREAVTSFASSMERFFEFGIKTILTAKQKKEAISTAWKHVAKQSERQLGGYIFLYLSEIGEASALLNTNQTGFRNSVIHGGYIPSREEAINFGQAIIDVIQPSLKELKTRYPKVIEAVIFQHLADQRDPKDQNVATLGINSAFSLSADPSLPYTARRMDDVLRQAHEWRKVMG
jgi:hypothetical protein